MLAAEHVQKLKRWHSYKANVIISCLEIVFWGAVAFLVFQGNLKSCKGVTCYLSWVTVGIAVFIKSVPFFVSTFRPYYSKTVLTLHSHLEIYASAIAIREFREYRKMRDGMPLSSVMSRGTDEEEMAQRFPQAPETTYQGRHEHRQTDSSRYQVQVVRGKQ